MKNRRNYYRILQVQPDAPLEIIRASYRTIMRELMGHPDFGGDHHDAIIFNEAYATLSDSVKRAEYDKKYLKYISNKTADELNIRKESSTNINDPLRTRPFTRQTKDVKDSQDYTDLKSKKTQKAYCENFYRAVNRVKMKGTELYYFTSSNKKRQAKILDLSPKGIRFTSTEKLTRESNIKIGCSLFKAEAEVVNYNQDLSSDRPVYSVGARFLKVKFKNQTSSFYSKFV